MSDFSSLDFRSALGRFATGVCLVTAVDEGGCAQAVTVNSFASVSLEPPLILWSVQKDSDVYELYRHAPYFAVGVLTRQQESHSSHYAQKGCHELAAEHFQSGANGAPLIRNALVNFECSLTEAIDGGDHTILLGRVTRLVPGDVRAEPLVFFAGDYRSLA
jgi:flavin reductase (DIM6/NTAB) family NADH-FMN oxidoreductase RutF